MTMHETHFVKRTTSRREPAYWREVEHPYPRARVIADVIADEIEADDRIWCAREQYHAIPARFADVSATIAAEAFHRYCEIRDVETVDDIPRFILAHAGLEIEEYFRERVYEERHRAAESMPS